MGVDAPIPPITMNAAAVEDFPKKIFSTAFGGPHRGASRDLTGRAGWRKFSERIFDPPPRRIRWFFKINDVSGYNLLAPPSLGEALRRGAIVFFRKCILMVSECKIKKIQKSRKINKKNEYRFFLISCKRQKKIIL
jgi:hypothetical protein